MSVRITQPVIPYCGRCDAGRRELLLDHELLDRAGVAPHGAGQCGIT